MRPIERVALLAVIAVAALVAALSAQSSVGGWNDGSRLATIESLVDRHTWAIDDSLFVRREAAPTPRQLAAVPTLTLDKLRIDGRFYSDKPPLLALLLAAPYQLWRWTGGAPAREQPDRFCYWMTFASAGVSYVVAVGAVFVLATVVGLPLATGLLLSGSLAFATLALPYSRSLNAHIVLLGVAALLTLTLARQTAPPTPGQRRWYAAGALAGFAYTLDLAAGPLLLASSAVFVAARRGGAAALARFLLAASPWLVAHHAITWELGGTLLPLNADPRRFDWPGSPFAAALTGRWQHDGGVDAGVYALALLIGKRGFLLHNLPAVLALAGIGVVWRRPPREAALLACGLVWAVATWLAYALASNNYSGSCASIRWFVPLLAPAYLGLAVLLRARPSWRVYLIILSIAGSALAAQMWWRGPWVGRMVPGFWPVQAAALAACIAARCRARVAAPSET